MSRLRILALAHQLELEPLVRAGLIEDAPTSDCDFACNALIYDNASLVNEEIGEVEVLAIATRGLDDERAILSALFEENPNVVLIFYGSRARADARFGQVIAQLSEWRGSQSISTQCAIILVKTCDAEASVAIPADATRLSATWVESAAADGKVADLQVLFTAALLNARRIIRTAPEVGIGVLLLNADGHFLLAERLKSPGRGLIGTFGGAMPPNSVPEPVLKLMGAQQFALPRELSIGAMLACTNMLVESEGTSHVTHYIDITYAAHVKRRSSEAVDVPRAGRHQPVDFEGQRRFWFNIEEVAALFLGDKLFAPVANAFQEYCAQKLAEIVSHIRPKNGHDVDSFLGLPDISAFHNQNLASLAEVVSAGDTRLSPHMYNSRSSI